MSESTRHIIKLILLVDAILALCLLAERKLAGADAWLYTQAAKLSARATDAPPQLHLPGEPVRMEKTFRHEHSRHYPTIYYIPWDADAHEGALALPLPKIQELATILHCLSSKVGVSHVGISAPLLWEDSRDEMARHMLTRALQSYSTACLGLPARNTVQPEGTPTQLQPAAIPPQQVQGDPARLPYANATLPYVSPVAELQALLWAPDYVEDEPRTENTTRGLSAPLLLRWKGEILPTLPLRLALARQGLTPADVQVRLGKSIRIGKRLLPLDALGRTPLGAAHSGVKTLPVTEVLCAPPGEPQAQLTAILSRPFTPDQTPRRGELLAATLSLLLSTDTQRYIPTEQPAGSVLLEQNSLQATFAGRIFLVLLIIATLAGLPLLPRPIQLAALGGLALLSIVTCLVWYCLGVWMSICACAAGILMLYGGVSLLSYQRQRTKKSAEQNAA